MGTLIALGIQLANDHLVLRCIRSSWARFQAFHITSSVSDLFLLTI